MLDHPPEGIIITISQQMLKERGYRDWYSGFKTAMDSEDGFITYWMRQGVQPKHDVLYVYLCIGGKIRFRSTFVGSYGKRWVEFTDGRTMYANAWIVLAGPMVRAPEPVYRKGFRGFRYTDFIF